MVTVASLKSSDRRQQVLVVGASGGIGLEFTRQLLQDPSVDRVFATYRQPDSAIALLELKDHYSNRLWVFRADVTDEGQIIEVIQQIGTLTDHLHLVINTVGILHEGTLQPEKSLRSINSEGLIRYFQVNSIATVLLAKHLVPLLKHKERSVFAAISAKVGSIGDNQLGGWYGYRASKAALNMFIKTIAIEFGRVVPQAIAVGLHPGTTDTDLSRPFHGKVPPDKLFSTEKTVNQLLAVLQGLTSEDSGSFLNWDGQKLPW
jgi:NAD(P)-dependent dehydrogenase (short-subunit alcohol dehydrogenase family)